VRKELKVTVQAEGAGAQATHLITVLVTFPISHRSPYRAEVTPDTTVGSVRQAAMTDFEVADSGEFTYVLTHDGAVKPDGTTIGQVAGDEARSVEFRLVKRITQG
jgi:hypothetical protein